MFAYILKNGSKRLISLTTNTCLRFLELYVGSFKETLPIETEMETWFLETMFPSFERIMKNNHKFAKTPQVWHSNRTGSASKVCSLGSARNWETWIIFEKVKSHVNNKTYSFIKPAFVEKCLRPVFNVIAVQTLYSWGEKLCLCIRDEPNNAWKTDFRTEGVVLLALIWIGSHFYSLSLFWFFIVLCYLMYVCIYLFNYYYLT